MTELHEAFAATLDVPGDSEPTLETTPPAISLITPQKVLFATAAAKPVQPIPTARWAATTDAVVGAIRRMFLTSTADTRPARRHYPTPSGFLEHSRMKREMRRS